MNGLFPFLATFLAATIEGVEMAAILVGVGTARGWRSTLLGSLAGFALLTVLTTVLGPLYSAFRSQVLRVIVGSLLLILGLQWLKKALLRTMIGRSLPPLQP
jgi:Ca2+/H+ antiporter, TMEM165/GDT1 family